MAVTSMSESSIGNFRRLNRMDTGVPAAVISGTTGSPDLATNGEAYVFSGSGSITVSKAGNLDILIVGGGGGANAGAGGAGGFLNETRFFEAGTHTIVVGAGGAAGGTRTGGSTGPTDGGNGNDSAIGNIWVPGGGAGSTIRSNATSSNNYIGGAGHWGGSGGGGGQTNGSGDALGPAGKAVAQGAYGFDGGKGGFLTGGGGGGAGQAGEDGGADYPAGSEGGNGAITTIISTTDATSFSVGQVSGSDVYFAGGGGGAPYTGAWGLGGLGGGGSNSAGSANTGGGASASGNLGGSGCVIVRVS